MVLAPPSGAGGSINPPDSLQYAGPTNLTSPPEDGASPIFKEGTVPPSSGEQVAEDFDDDPGAGGDFDGQPATASLPGPPSTLETAWQYTKAGGGAGAGGREHRQRSHGNGDRDRKSPRALLELHGRLVRSEHPVHSQPGLVEKRCSGAAYETDFGHDLSKLAGTVAINAGTSAYALAAKAAAAATTVAQQSAEHHSWPQYLQGPAKQALESLPADLHNTYHGGLDKLLLRQYGSEYYQQLSPAQQAANFETLRKYTQAFDQQYGTNLWEAIKKTASAKPGEP